MLNPLTPWRRFLARPNDDHVKVFGVAILVAMICAAFVSTAAVALKPLQDAHLEAERAARMAQMLDTLPGMREVMEEAGVDALETRVVEMATGTFVTDIDPDSFDVQAAANDPEQSTAIPSDADIAGLHRRADHALVHLLERDGALLLVVLPVQGTGYQSTIRAMLALEPDLNTIAALTITEQGETPGIGARVQDPAWQALWPGRQVADENGNIVISVVRGTATAPYEVDGISGATATSNGVANMLRYWLGDHGYGPFLDRLATEGL
ncbi:Na+-transporting NADH:ubiquinone oxidoreductase subunit C [Yoonia maricola]|uniref:Na(+)-translocating NADH-quinone reductase subunit C n=1 Tax=Yoonia maricola TaxID=420999 RepID=A0A2M8W0C1_9RHOB|nr:NADH:ubiquinone reductase (Na(+)-transporting) subunit C [Yoonia maricola]PJI84370.1 Na+-transporting NADH:ubiquinone oxidoreductase subunit C [Yoonia maricola]